MLKKSLLFGMGMLFAASSAGAATLYFEPSSEVLLTGGEKRVGLFLDPAGEQVNAIEGTIRISGGDFFDVVRIEGAGSLVTIWVTEPVHTGDRIDFAGIMPGGFGGVIVPLHRERRPGKIFDIVLSGKKTGSGGLSWEGARALVNDGQGTPVSLSLLPLAVDSIPVLGAPLEKISDTEPPETFTPMIARDPTLFGGKWFVAFVTDDKESGMDHYEVCEGSENRCVSAESPYLLLNQSVARPVFVKAIDVEGNERVASIAPLGETPWYRRAYIFVILAGGFVMCGLWVKKRIWPKRA